MDLRNGRMYDSKEAALEAGVPESDIAELVYPKEIVDMRNAIPKVQFSKNPFGSFKNAEPVK